MNNYMIKIPVLIGVLVFIFLQTGCAEKEIIALEQVQHESEPVQTAETEAVILSETAEQQSDAPVPMEVVVHICGAVQNPGVYRLAEGSRICDVIQMAGGLSADASDRSINQAALATDGMQIVVPTLEEAEQAGTAAEGAAVTGAVAEDDSGLVNLNTATLAELMTLPGIGETRAKAILEYREKNGKFSQIEEIMQVNGIKEGSFEKLREYITVG